MTLEIALLVALVACCTCASMARDKNRSSWRWALFGLIFPLPAIFAVSLVRDLPPPWEDEPY